MSDSLTNFRGTNDTFTYVIEYEVGAVICDSLNHVCSSKWFANAQRMVLG